MNDIISAAEEVQTFCVSHQWKFCFIGGLALQRWGDPRETVDVDLSLFVGFNDVTPFTRELLNQFEPRIDQAEVFAAQHRVLLLRSSKGVGLDVALASLPYEELMIERSSIFNYPPGIPLRTCSAEDLLVLKAFAGRNQDWVDIDKVITKQTGKLDWAYIYTQLQPLAELKESPEILTELQRRRAEFEQ